MARFRKGDEVQLTGVVAIDYDDGTGPAGKVGATSRLNSTKRLHHD